MKKSSTFLSHIFRTTSVEMIQHIVRVRISDRVVEQIIDDQIPGIQDHIDELVTVMPKEFGGRKLESTAKDGSDLKVITVIGGDAEHMKKS